jgi:hypothetical protein
MVALEAAIEEFATRALGDNDRLNKETQAFWDAPLPMRSIMMIAAKWRSNSKDMEAVGEVVRTRNEIIHEAWTPPADETRVREPRNTLLGCLRAAATLLEGPRLRFPKGNPTNTLA